MAIPIVVVVGCFSSGVVVVFPSHLYTLATHTFPSSGFPTTLSPGEERRRGGGGGTVWQAEKL